MTLISRFRAAGGRVYFAGDQVAIRGLAGPDIELAKARKGDVLAELLTERMRKIDALYGCAKRIRDHADTPAEIKTECDLIIDGCYELCDSCIAGVSEMADRFAERYPDVVTRVQRVAEWCRFAPVEGAALYAMARRVLVPSEPAAVASVGFDLGAVETAAPRSQGSGAS